jgi:hypothetical protein
MRYMCLVYVEEATFDAMSERERRQLTNACADYDDELTKSGHLVMASPLDLPETATTVRVRKGKLSATDGPFAETKEHLGGFMMIEASDLNEAIRLASGSPMAGAGSVEVRPMRPLKRMPLDD